MYNENEKKIWERVEELCRSRKCNIKYLSPLPPPPVELRNEWEISVWKFTQIIGKEK